MNQQGNNSNNLLERMYQHSTNTIKIEDNSLIKVTTAQELQLESENMTDLTPLYEPFFYEGELHTLCRYQLGEVDIIGTNSR